MSYVIGPLLRKALTPGILHRAWRKVSDNKGMAGIDGESITILTPDIDAILHELAHTVMNGNYQPWPLLRLWVERPGKSPRGLAVPVIRDRILQTSLAWVLTLIIETELEDCSYAYRPGRGVHQAIERVRFYQRQGYQWIVDADIETFFDTIPHANLLARLQTLAPEPSLIALVTQWLTAPVQDNGQLTYPQQGIPQGSPISPLLANLYLNTLDETLLDAGHVLIRYADDFIVLAKSREKAEDALKLSRDTLERLALRLNPLKTRIVHFDEGLEFLGWHIVRNLAIPLHHREIAFHLTRPEAAAPRKKVVQDTKTPGLLSSGLPSEQEKQEKQDEQPASRDSGFHPPILPEDQDTEGDKPTLPPLAPLQRTLYLVDYHTRLIVDNQRYRIVRGDETLLTVSAHQVGQIILFGQISVSTRALHLAARNQCSISYLSRYGRYYGRFEPANDRQITLLQAQFSCQTDSQFQLGIVRTIIMAKLHNCRVILARSQRHQAVSQSSDSAKQRLQQIEHSLNEAVSIDSLRGSEGAAAALYWRSFAALIPAPWQFDKRRAHPSPDPINALLSLGYTLLYQAVAGLLQARGLNAHLGMLHVSRGKHLALASDLMEVFRAYIVDACVLKLLHTQQLDTGGYTVVGNVCRLDKETTRVFIRAIEDRFNSVQLHPQSGLAVDIRRIIDHDVLTLIKAYHFHDARHYQATRWR